MIIGVPKEIKPNENRVAATPADIGDLIHAGHEVLVEKNAGLGSGFTDDEYETVGAQILEDPAEVWKAKMVVKVKEPMEEEYKYFYDGLILFTYLHLANDKKLTDALVENNVAALGYETISVNGTLPLLKPMSEVAGRFAVQAGAQFLQHRYGGSGVLLGGIPGVERGKVVIIGGGVVGVNAAKMALGLGARVTILDVDQEQLGRIDDIFGQQIDTLMSNSYNIGQVVKDADVVIGSVLIAGAKAPILVTEEMVKSMRPGSVVVDVAVDQGGNFETTEHATTHDDPIYKRHDVIHYAVANIPGAVPRTATIGLTNVTMRYIAEVANKGLEKAFLGNRSIMRGINVYKGLVTNKGVAQALDYKYTNMYDLIRG
ncbi:L-alanine dehydrogenase [Atopostipes suicloacalis DSM 15692]|uniref:Alanine dehydrogenase n=1 Tax=Atopostipes suicloacalis DSM 15692 TaxID=1121025 RepID=A0A1M4T1E9_9LACT|nr:alanine dehydrogenase [Atopostipes suicloacalis]SHE38303.1 L-alanine dehydrogenase [Atopostipes suicloacalis DSM 15692]